MAVLWYDGITTKKWLSVKNNSKYSSANPGKSCSDPWGWLFNVHWLMLKSMRIYLKYDEIRTIAECLEKQLFTRYHKLACYTYAKPHINKLETFRQKVLWSDETKVELFERNNRRYIWWAPNKYFEEKNLIQTNKHNGDSIMIWECLAAFGTGKIIRINSTMVSARYQEILRESKLSSV